MDIFKEPINISQTRQVFDTHNQKQQHHVVQNDDGVTEARKHVAVSDSVY
jgi:hypothetical protein